MQDVLALFIVAITLLVVILLDRSEHKGINKVLEWIPAILFAYVVPALFTHIFQLDLSSVFLHALSKQFIMPLAIVAVMSALSFRQLKAVGWKPIGVFLSGSAAVALLPILLLMIFNNLGDGFREEILEHEYWKGLVTIVGSWIGGSTSQLVLKELVECPEEIFLIILVMDNVLVNLWTILMFQFIKRSDQLNQKLRISEQKIDFIPDEQMSEGNGKGPILQSIGICIAAVLVCGFLIDSFLLIILILSFLGLALGNFFPKWDHAFVIKAGGYLIILIMAILGLKLNFSNFSIPAYVLIFSVIWLVLHYVVMMLTAYVMKLDMAWVPISSMANVGGISTAPAVTKAYNEELMPHAILLAILSMVSGTYWGMLTIYLFGLFF